jgi:hypothetical protein
LERGFHEKGKGWNGRNIAQVLYPSHDIAHAEGSANALQQPLSSSAARAKGLAEEAESDKPGRIRPSGAAIHHTALYKDFLQCKKMELKETPPSRATHRASLEGRLTPPGKSSNVLASAGCVSPTPPEPRKMLCSSGHAPGSPDSHRLALYIPARLQLHRLDF